MKPAKLEAKFRKEIQILAEQISEDKPLAEGRSAKFFESIFPSDGIQLKTLKLYAATTLYPEPDSTITYIVLPFQNRIAGLKIEGDNLVISVKASVHRATVEQEPVMEWVEIDKETKKLKPSLDKNDQPKFREKRTETKNKEIYVFRFPVKLFVDILTEIGLTSIIEPPPEDYIPKKLGSPFLTELFSGCQTYFGPDFFMNHAGFDLPFGDMSRSKRDRYMIHNGPPPWFRAGRSPGNPVRVFLQPEKGTKRVEVVVEPYSDEEVRTNRELTSTRTLWAALNVFSTKAITAFLEHVIPEAK